MTLLTHRQRQLLFDYSFGLTTAPETAEVEELLAVSEEAAELYQAFQAALAPLASVALEPCPDELTNRLFVSLRQIQASSGGNRLRELLAAEQTAARAIKVPLWRNWSEVVAAAAVIVLFVSILFPTIGFMRQRYWQARCAAQLGSIYGGLRNYVSDHDGLLPAVAVTPGAPWWKVGYQGDENHSNTRPLWLLVRYRYVEPNRFFCPGRREDHRLNFDGFQVQNFNDFPSRAYIHFSVRVPCPTANDRDLMQRQVLMADLNPLSERLPSDYNASVSVELCEKLIRSNSRNHRYRGQNALLYDGAVEFTRVRRTSLFDDDIYILRDMSCGTEVHGFEWPASDTDIFLAP